MRSALFISASSKKDSANWRLARAAKELMDREAQTTIKTELVDLAAPELPTFSSNDTPTAAVNELIQHFSEATTIVMSSDEYTGAYSSKLRNALLWIKHSSATPDAPLSGRQILLIGLTPRGAGGLRGHAALKQLLSEFGATVSSQYLDVGSAPSAFASDTRLIAKAEHQLIGGSLRALMGP